tara:strand:- start:922 stop:1161 length:240 start_codon:yes stop_codon:yes gene_type:complete
METIGFIGGSQHGTFRRVKYPDVRFEIAPAIKELIYQHYSQCDPEALTEPSPKRETYVPFTKNVYILESLNKHLEETKD